MPERLRSTLNPFSTQNAPNNTCVQLFPVPKAKASDFNAVDVRISVFWFYYALWEIVKNIFSTEHMNKTVNKCDLYSSIATVSFWIVSSQYWRYSCGKRNQIKLINVRDEARWTRRTRPSCAMLIRSNNRTEERNPLVATHEGEKDANEAYRKRDDDGANFSRNEVLIHCGSRLSKLISCWFVQTCECIQGIHCW